MKFPIPLMELVRLGLVLGVSVGLVGYSDHDYSTILILVLFCGLVILLTRDYQMSRNTFMAYWFTMMVVIVCFMAVFFRSTFAADLLHIQKGVVP